MDITVKYDIITEANCLYFVGYEISRGFFLKNGFYVLPNTISKHNPNKYSSKNIDKNSITNPASDSTTNPTSPIIVLPPLNYTKAFGNVKGFRNNLHTFQTASNNELKPIISEIKNKEVFQEIDSNAFSKLKKDYENILLKTYKQATETFKQLKGKNISITVFPSNFGSYGSFTLFDKNLNDINIELRIRLDQPKEVLVELFTSSIVRSIIDIKANWNQSEAIIDFFVKHIFGYDDYVGTISRINKKDKNLLNKSISYLMSLNLNTGDLLKFNQESNRIILMENDITDEFGPYELRMLRLLTKNKYHTVSFDQLADEMYNVNADLKYSLWGITKTLQRVRGKLEYYGIPKDAIQNVKGEGYKLVV